MPGLIFVLGSDITFNICLGTDFEGAEVFFYPRSVDDIKSISEETQIFQSEHQVGYGMLHFGRQLHGTRKLISGHRVNIVVWSRQWRNPTIDE